MPPVLCTGTCRARCLAGCRCGPVTTPLLRQHKPHIHPVACLLIGVRPVKLEWFRALQRPCPCVRAQSKLFPTFFGLNSAMALVALATLYFSGVGALRPQQISLGALTAIHLWFYFWTCRVRNAQTVAATIKHGACGFDHGAEAILCDLQ